VIAYTIVERGSDRIALLIPVYNGADALEGVIARCKALGMPILVVDDGSTDETPAIVARSGVDHSIRCEKNEGKGKALQIGFRFASETGYEAAVTLDADGQHRPEEVPKFMERYLRGGVDILAGNRFGDEEYLRRMPWQRVMSNRLSSGLIRRFGRLPLRDIQCGFRLYRLRSICGLSWRSSGFEFETEILLGARANGCRMENVPVQCEYPQGTDRSQFSALRDSWRIARVVWRSRWEHRGKAGAGV